MRFFFIILLIFAKLANGQTLKTCHDSINSFFSEKDYNVLKEQLKTTKTVKLKLPDGFLARIHLDFNGKIKHTVYKWKRIELVDSAFYFIKPCIITKEGIGFYILENMKNHVTIPFLKFEDTLYINNMSNLNNYLTYEDVKYDRSKSLILFDFLSKYNMYFSGEQVKKICIRFLWGIEYHDRVNAHLMP